MERKCVEPKTLRGLTSGTSARQNLASQLNSSIQEKKDMDVFRAVYVVAEDTDYGQWMQRFWNGASDEEDPLRQLLCPDVRGEVTAWGVWPHWSSTDALTTSDPDGFARLVKTVCRLAQPPTIYPEELSIFGSNALVVKCGEIGLAALRSTLVEATRHLIARLPLADEEFQKAEWWIRHVGNDPDKHLRSLWMARDLYLDAGSPALPSSRHFRLGFLVRLSKEIERAKDASEAGEKAKHLQYLFTRGEPYWYSTTGGLHTTIASGLTVHGKEDREEQIVRFTKLLWPTIEKKLGSFRPAYLAIMGEDPENKVTVHFMDWLTETFVEETRPGFTVVDRAPFD